MCDLKTWGTISTGLFSWLSSLSWPIFAFIIIWIFRHPIAKLIANIRKAKFPWGEFEIGDEVPAYSPKDKVIYAVKLQPSIVEGLREKTIQRLPNDEIERSRTRAIARLNDDTAKVGYQRGKLLQNKDGSYSISWNVQSSISIGVKANAGEDIN